MYYDIQISGRLFCGNRWTWSKYIDYIKSFGSRDAFALISCFWTILAACGPRHESRLGHDHVIKAKWSGHCANPNPMYLGELFIYALDCQGWSHRMVYDGDAEGTQTKFFSNLRAKTIVCLGRPLLLLFLGVSPDGTSKWDSWKYLLSRIINLLWPAK